MALFAINTHGLLMLAKEYGSHSDYYAGVEHGELGEYVTNAKARHGRELITRTDAAGIWARYGTTVNHFSSDRDQRLAAVA